MFKLLSLFNILTQPPHLYLATNPAISTRSAFISNHPRPILPKLGNFRHQLLIGLHLIEVVSPISLFRKVEELFGDVMEQKLLLGGPVEPLERLGPFYAPERRGWVRCAGLGGGRGVEGCDGRAPILELI